MMIRCERGRVVRVRAEADWTSLPDLVLELIVGSLDSAETCVRFALVCKSWGSSVFRSWPQPRHHRFRSLLNRLAPHPMLLIGDNLAFSVFSGKVFPLDPLIFRRGLSDIIRTKGSKSGAPSFIIGSSFGCLFNYCPDDRRKVRIFYTRQSGGAPLDHPITHSTPTYKKVFPQLIGSRPVKAVSNLDPSLESIDGVVAIWFTDSNTHNLLLLESSITRCMSAIRPSKILSRGRLHLIRGRILDIASVDSAVFWLEITTPQNLFVSRVSKLFDRPVRSRLVFYDDPSFQVKLPTPALSRLCTAYLVGLDDTPAPSQWPWLVLRHKTLDCDGNMSTVGFQVFEGVRSVRRARYTELSFVRVNKLQNHVLFLGKKSALHLAVGSGLTAALGLLEPNTVYYLDDGDCDNLDMGVFDMERGCRRPLPIPIPADELMKHQSPPLWFLY